MRAAAGSVNGLPTGHPALPEVAGDRPGCSRTLSLLMSQRGQLWPSWTAKHLAGAGALRSALEGGRWAGPVCRHWRGVRASHPVPAASSAPSPALATPVASPGQTWVNAQEAREAVTVPVPAELRADLGALRGLVHRLGLQWVPGLPHPCAHPGRAEDQRSARLLVLRRSMACSEDPAALHRPLRGLPRGVQGLPQLGQGPLGMGWALALDAQLSPRCTPSPPAPAHPARAFHA